MTSIQLDNFVRDLTARGTLEIMTFDGKSFVCRFTPHESLRRLTDHESRARCRTYRKPTVYEAIEALWTAVVTDNKPSTAS